MISILTPLAEAQLPFMRPIGDDFQIGEFLIRRVRGDKFLIWNTEGEMLETDSAKVGSALREFFNDEF